MSKELGIRLYHIRTHKTDYSHQQIADLLNIERSTYTKYETGQQNPPVYILRGLKKIFGVSYDELIDVELKEEEIADYEMCKRLK